MKNLKYNIAGRVLLYYSIGVAMGCVAIIIVNI